MTIEAHTLAIAVLLEIDIELTGLSTIEHAVGAHLIWGYFENSYHGDEVHLTSKPTGD